KNLTSGKAIDVSLGTLYAGPASPDVAGYSAGAVNIRAQSFTGNILNVEAHGAGGASANLVNFSSTQLAGKVLNVNATALTTGKAVAVTLGTAGTGIYVNTAAAYTGNLLELDMNASPKFTIDQAGNATIAGTLNVTGAATLSSTLAVTGDVSVNTNKFNVSAATGNTTIAGTLGVTGAATFSSTLGVTGDLAVNTNKFNVTAATGNTTIAGTLGVTGATTLSSTLNVSGTTSLATGSTNNFVVTGPATGVPPSIALAGTDANINLQLTPKGTGGIIIGTGGQPIAGHFSVSTSLNFGTAMAAGQCENLTATVTGAVVGDTVIATLTAVAGGAESFVTA